MSNYQLLENLSQLFHPDQNGGLSSGNNEASSASSENEVGARKLVKHSSRAREDELAFLPTQQQSSAYLGAAKYDALEKKGSWRSKARERRAARRSSEKKGSWRSRAGVRERRGARLDRGWRQCFVVLSIWAEKKKRSTSTPYTPAAERWFCFLFYSPRARPETPISLDHELFRWVSMGILF